MTTTTIGWLDPGQVRGEFTESVTQAAAYEAMHHRLAQVIRIQSGPLLEEGRNLLVERFLANGSDWLFMADSDMTFSYDAISRLRESALFTGGKFIGGLAFGINKAIGPFPTIYRKQDGMPAAVLDVPDGIVEVEATGAAFCLIHRTVFTENRRDQYHPWYHRQFVPANKQHGGGWIGEDISWCFWLGSRGVKMYVDPRVEAGHVKATNVCRATYAREAEAARGAP